MKKLLLIIFAGLMAVTVNAQYEVRNGGFEEWEAVTNGEEPLNWSSFLTASGSMSSMVAKEQLFKATEVRPGSAGQYSAKITAATVFGVVAQGNMTSGCINAGSTSAMDASGNYNYTNEDNEGQCMVFTGRPDAVRVWVNLYTGNADYPTGNVSVFLHEKGYYQDPNTANRDKLARMVAHAKATPASSGSAEYSEEGWQELIIPFEYASTSRPYYMLASFSTNSTPGKGSASDWMYIDDMEVLYYSELASAVYGGEELTFVDGLATVDALYNQKMLNVTSTGVGAAIEYEIDEESYLLTITIKGDNISEDPTNVHTYQIQFSGIASNDADDEADMVVVPGTVTLESNSTLVSGNAYYLYNVAQGGYLNNNDQLSEAPEVLWTINKENGTITDAEGHYVRIDRTADNLREVDYSNFPVTSSRTDWDTGMNFTFETEDGFIRFCRKQLNAYKGGLFGTSWKKADIYAGATGMTQLYACAVNDNNGKWKLFSDEDFAIYNNKLAFWNDYASASLANGVDATAFVVKGMAQTLSGMPLGIYEFGETGKFYLPFGEDMDVTEEQSLLPLTYYGRLDFSLNATYDGVALTDGQELDTLYEEGKLEILLGNGAESYLENFDTETFRLTIVIMGYGRSREYEIQFAAPELTLRAEWYGEYIEEGATIDEEYNEEALTLTSGNGTTYTTEYDETTGLLTVTVTSIYGQTAVYTYQFVVYSAVKSTVTYDDAEEISQYCNSVAYTGTPATVTVETLKDGKVHFLLNDFTTLNAEGTIVSLGTLAAKGLDKPRKGVLNYTGNVRTADGTFAAVTISTTKLSDTELQAAVSVVYDNVLTQYFYGIRGVSEETFEGNVHVDINGTAAGDTESEITVTTLNNGNINFSLQDFAIEGIGKVGTISLLNLPYDSETGKFEYEGSLHIAPGSTGEPSDWIGPALGAIPVHVTGTKSAGILSFAIDIDLQEQTGQVITVTYTGVETAINAVSDAGEHADAPAYDLSGRRAGRAAKGLLIINGKKVIR